MEKRLQLGVVVAVLLCAAAGWLLLHGEGPRALKVAPPAALVEALGEDAATEEMELEKPEQDRAESKERVSIPATLVDDPVVPLREGEEVVRVVVSTRTKRGGGPETIAANVHVRVGADPEASVGATSLGEVTTNSEGQATLEIPYRALERIMDQAAPSIWARVEQTGLMALREFVEAARVKPGGTVNLTVVATPGGILAGTLLGLDGEPVDGEVRSYRLQDSGSWDSEGWGFSRADGQFELRIRESGMWRLEGDRRFRLGGANDSAGGGDAGGTAVSEVLDLDILKLPQDFELRLRGPGVIEGRVFDGAGRPAAGLELLVIAVDASKNALGMLGARITDFDDLMPAPSSERKTAEDYGLEGAGDWGDKFVTDAEGRFRVRGLLDGRFMVLAKDTSSSGRWGQYSDLLTPEPVWSRGPSLELTLERQYLVVIVRGEGSEAAALIGKRDALGLAEDWPGVPSVMVVPGPRPHSTWGQVPPPIKGRATGGGVFAFDPELGRDYFVSLLAPGLAPDVRRVRLGESSGCVEVVFELPAAHPNGKLSLDVTNSLGSRVTRNLSVRIVDPVTGAWLLERNHFLGMDGSRAWPAVFELPTGEYELEVAGTVGMDINDGSQIEPRRWGEFRSSILIRAGEATAVTAELPEPARVTLSLDGDVVEADRQAVSGGDAKEVAGDDWRLRARVSLTSPGRYPEGVPFLVSPRSKRSALVYSLPIGTTQKSEALPSGRFLLTATMPGGRTASEWIDLVPGQTLAVTLVPR